MRFFVLTDIFRLKCFNNEQDVRSGFKLQTEGVLSRWRHLWQCYEQSFYPTFDVSNSFLETSSEQVTEHLLISKEPDVERAWQDFTRKTNRWDRRTIKKRFQPSYSYTMFNKIELFWFLNFYLIPPWVIFDTSKNNSINC